MRRGFTLVELLIVIIILASLAAIVVPKFTNSGLRAREAALKTDLKMYRDAVNRFNNDTGLFPETLDDLTPTKAPDTGLDRAGASTPLRSYQGPYILEVVPDPITGDPFDYDIIKFVGTVKSTAPGKATNGTNYTDW